MSNLPPRSVRVASWVVAVVALLLALSATFILFAPVDATNFAAETGLDWSGFSVANPEASSYLAREARVLAVGYLTLGLLAAILAWRPIRAGSSWALVALWIFTTGMLATSLVFFGAGDTAIGATYLTAAVVSAGALIIAARSPAQRP
jgi:predicted anti-sigma-YlaC factor YlaD